MKDLGIMCPRCSNWASKCEVMQGLRSTGSFLPHYFLHAEIAKGGSCLLRLALGWVWLYMVVVTRIFIGHIFEKVLQLVSSLELQGSLTSLRLAGTCDEMAVFKWGKNTRSLAQSTLCPHTTTTSLCWNGLSELGVLTFCRHILETTHSSELCHKTDSFSTHNALWYCTVRGNFVVASNPLTVSFPLWCWASTRINVTPIVCCLIRVVVPCYIMFP